MAKKRLSSARILVAKSYKKERSPALSLHDPPSAPATDRARPYGSPRAYAVVGEIWYPSPTASTVELLAHVRVRRAFRITSDYTWPAEMVSSPSWLRHGRGKLFCADGCVPSNVVKISDGRLVLRQQHIRAQRSVVLQDTNGPPIDSHRVIRDVLQEQARLQRQSRPRFQPLPAHELPKLWHKGDIVDCLCPAGARNDGQRVGYFRAAESRDSRAPCSRHCILTMHLLGSALRICNHCCPPHGIHEEPSALSVLACSTIFQPWLVSPSTSLFGDRVPFCCYFGRHLSPSGRDLHV